MEELPSSQVQTMAGTELGTTTHNCTVLPQQLSKNKLLKLLKLASLSTQDHYESMDFPKIFWIKYRLF